MELMVKTLSNGVKVPILGFIPSTGGDVSGLVQNAVNSGYRHVISDVTGDQDRSIAMVAHSGSLPREELFLSMKVQLPDPDDVDYDVIEWATELRKRIWSLSRDKLDMVILTKNSYADSMTGNADSTKVMLKCWQNLVSLVKTGKVRCAAVEDLHQEEVQLLSKITADPLIAFTTNFKTVTDFKSVNSQSGRETGITLPFSMRRWAHNKLGEMHGKALADIAKSMDKSIEQVVARFMMQKNLFIICSIQQAFKTFQIWDFALSKQDFEKVSGLLNGHALIM